MKIEEGKYYLNGAGNVVGPMKKARQPQYPDYPWIAMCDEDLYASDGQWLTGGTGPKATSLRLIQECTKEGEPIMDNLKDLERAHERLMLEAGELGKEIERLKNKLEPLTFGRLDAGDAFRLNGMAWRRIKTDSRNCAFLRRNGSISIESLPDNERVVLQDEYGNDLPPEQQVKP